ncbi:MAG TPA: FKBP-type peptidyl-prolyl cis-trans isomerase [Xanthomonadaceae bacterium]|nr:FKBP-type peptidyl-prolyl cis-trans isomerase [Xanthomonadaceae bacterium]
MKSLLRGAAAFLLAFAGLAPNARAADVAPLATDRAKASYMVGMDVGHSLTQVAPDLDLAAFEKAVRNAFAGGKPLVSEAQAKPLGEALMQRMAVRSGRAPAGTSEPAVSKEQAGYLVGADVGRSLGPIKDEIDLPVMMQALRTVLAKGKPLLSEDEANAVRTAFSQQVQGKVQAAAAAQAGRNAAEGVAFLAGNKAVKGVYTTPSGLQYMVLRQGAGPRPKPGDRVRVNYEGRLLDGSVFDSSYARGEPAEFGLDQVIAGWSEGVTLMPVGSKYRFWIPANLAYGEKGTPGGPIGPNSTLQFDVELMDILQ